MELVISVTIPNDASRDDIFRILHESGRVAGLTVINDGCPEVDEQRVLDQVTFYRAE